MFDPRKLSSNWSGCKLRGSMATPHASPGARFGRFGIFEVSLVAGELRKNGTRIHLQEQPFQLLVLLLERSGDVVAHEEIIKKLWDPDTFVDFDKSVNTAVNKVREALGDSATTPRYVETVRRGYRFLVPVQWSIGQPPPIPPRPKPP